MMSALTERGRPLYDRAREMAIEPISPADIGDLLELDPADALDAHLVIGGYMGRLDGRPWGILDGR